jgi:polar amino acid transport system substrate-binding protein
LPTQQIGRIERRSARLWFLYGYKLGIAVLLRHFLSNCWLYLVLLFCVSYCTTLVAATAQPAAAAACQFSMQVQHFPPRMIKTERAGQTHWRGFNVDLFRLLVSKVGCQPLFQELPWGRSLLLLQQGELTAMSNMSLNAERQQYAEFIGPFLLEQIVAIGPQALQQQVTSLASLRQYALSIGLMQGIYYGPEFAKASQEPVLAAKLVYVSTNQQKLQLLYSERVQVVFEDLLNYQLLRQSGQMDAAQFQPLFTLYRNGVYFAFSKQSTPAAQLQQLHQAWQQLVASGELRQLQQQYQLMDFALSP